MTKEKADINELRWVRLFSPDLIPRYLVEQAKTRDYDIDDFYKYQRINCMVQTNDGFTLNQLNHLYALVDKGNDVMGFVWYVLNPLSKSIIINTYSLDDKYWGKGAVEKLSNHIKEMLNKLKLRKVFWITNYPKHSEKHGFKRSKHILMEYSPEEEKNGTSVNGRSRARRGRIDADADAEPISQTAAEPVGAPGN